MARGLGEKSERTIDQPLDDKQSEREDASAFEEGNLLYYKQRRYKRALEAYKEVPKKSRYYATAQRYIGYNIYCREWDKCEQGLPDLDVDGVPNVFG